MSVVIKPPPPSVPLVELIEGRFVVNVAWDLFFRALVERTGGVDAPTNSELAVALHDDAGIEEMKSTLYRIRDEYAFAPPTVEAIKQELADARVEALEATVAELRKEIEALKVGTVL